MICSSIGAGDAVRQQDGFAVRASSCYHQMNGGRSPSYREVVDCTLCAYACVCTCLCTRCTCVRVRVCVCVCVCAHVHMRANVYTCTSVSRHSIGVLVVRTRIDNSTGKARERGGGEWCYVTIHLILQHCNIIPYHIAILYHAPHHLPSIVVIIVTIMQQGDGHRAVVAIHGHFHGAWHWAQDSNTGEERSRREKQ